MPHPADRCLPVAARRPRPHAGCRAGLRREIPLLVLAVMLVAQHAAVAAPPTRRSARTPTPSCGDGLRNQDETEIDCGGNNACSRCALNQTCRVDSDCLSGRCTDGRCKCGDREFTFTVVSNEGGWGDSAAWPGGTQSQTSSPGCSVTINNPNANIDLICTLAAPFAVNGFTGFTSCSGLGGEDGDGCEAVECPPAGIGMCCAGRPSCSAALNGRGKARYHVRCRE